MLEATIRRYQNRTIEAAQVIAELIELSKQMREGQKRGESLGLTDDEVPIATSWKRTIVP
jgi:type I restriction enzyme R subunit